MAYGYRKSVKNIFEYGRMADWLEPWRIRNLSSLANFTVLHSNLCIRPICMLRSEAHALQLTGTSMRRPISLNGSNKVVHTILGARSDRCVL